MGILRYVEAQSRYGCSDVEFPFSFFKCDDFVAGCVDNDTEVIRYVCENYRKPTQIKLENDLFFWLETGFEYTFQHRQFTGLAFTSFQTFDY